MTERLPISSELGGPACDIESHAIVKPRDMDCSDGLTDRVLAAAESSVRSQTDSVISRTTLDEEARLNRLGGEFFVAGVTG